MLCRFLLLTTVLTSLTIPAFAQSITETQKKEIEGIVHQYLLDNPEVLFEAADRHQQNLEKKANEDAKKVLSERADQLFKNPKYGIIGNKDAKVAFVEFFDYNCGYCKQAFKDLVDLTDKNRDIKIILIDAPILGPTSLDAAKWAIAAGTFGKYSEFHKELMHFQGPKTEETLTKMAKDVGLDPVKVKAVAATQETTDQISKNMELFSALGLSGTPGFAAPDRLLRGFVGPEMLEQIAKELQTASSVPVVPTTTK